MSFIHFYVQQVGIFSEKNIQYMTTRVASHWIIT